MNPFAPVAGIALAAFASCASSEAERRAEVSELVARGYYAEAVRVAAEQSQKRPGDKSAEENYRVASAAYLLEQGRRATFADRDDEALEHFYDALEIAPDLPEVRAWIEKTRNKLTFRWLNIAAERYALEDLPGAQAAYEQVLVHDPQNPQASFGLGRVLLLINHRTGVGEEYYNQGVRALADYWLNQAKSSFAYTSKYLPGLERANQREQEVKLLLAGQRAALARDLEEQGSFAAAKNEYRLTILLDPQHAEAQEGFKRCGLEVEAEEDLEIAGMMVVLYYGIGHYFMGFMLGLKAFTAAVLGGIGNVAGAMLGGMLLGVVESLATGYIGDLTGGVLGSNYRDIFAFLVLILVLVFRPSGLLGERAADRA